MNTSNIIIDGVDSRLDPVGTVNKGVPAAKQSAFDLLKHRCFTFFLWSDSKEHRENKAVTNGIIQLVPQCVPEQVAELAVRLRTKQNLRHIPLVLVRELFKIPEARKLAGETLPRVILRPDEITAFLALYWSEGKVPLAAQLKKGLGEAFNKFGAHSLAKYKDEGQTLALRDVMHLVHVKPVDSTRTEKWDKAARRQARLQGDGRKNRQKGVLPVNATRKEVLFQQLSNKDLPVPETRETLLSKAKSPAEKRAAYTKLLEEKALGAQALLMNLSGMTLLGVDSKLISKAIKEADPTRLLPLQFMSAQLKAPQFTSELSFLMQKCLAGFTKLKGKTVVIVDMSGSMNNRISAGSEFTRIHAASTLAMMAREMCSDITIYATAGVDPESRQRPGHHLTVKVEPTRGFDLLNTLSASRGKIGIGGIFTRQALEFVKQDLGEVADEIERVIVISDSEDCDIINPIPKPFAKYNYIINIAANQFGINYKGAWTQEINGWSQYFVEYIAECEEGFQASLFN